MGTAFQSKCGCIVLLAWWYIGIAQETRVWFFKDVWVQLFSSAKSWERQHSPEGTMALNLNVIEWEVNNLKCASCIFGPSSSRWMHDYGMDWGCCKEIQDFWRKVIWCQDYCSNLLCLQGVQEKKLQVMIMIWIGNALPRHRYILRRKPSRNDQYPWIPIDQTAHLELKHLLYCFSYLSHLV